MGTFVVLSLIGVAVDGPTRRVADFAASFGPGGSVALIVLVTGGAFLFWRWAVRRDARRRIVQTGIIDVPQPPDRRATRTFVRWMSAPIWPAAAVLFLVCVYVTIRGPA